MAIQTYLDLHSQIKKVNKLIENKPCFIQKVYSSTYWIDYYCRIPGESFHLLMGRGNHFESLFIDRAIESKFRRKDKFLDYLRKNLRGSRLAKINLDEKDRIICFSLQRKQMDCYYLYFYSGRKSYFVFAESKDNVFISWRGKVSLDTFELDTLYKLFDEVGRKSIIKTKEGKGREIDWEIEEDLLGIDISKEEKKKNKKKKNILNDLKKIENRSKLKELIDGLETINNGKVTLAGFKFNFGHDLNFYEKRDLIYKKIKGLKKAEGIQRKRLEKLNDLHTNEISISFKKSPILPIWETKNRELVVKKVIGAHKIVDNENYRLLIGLSAQGNDEIRKMAKKDDWWFHLDSQQSAHIIVQIKNNLMITNENLLKEIAAVFSESKYQSEVDMIYTQIKNLRSVKGAAGKVRYKKEKRVRILLD